MEREIIIVALGPDDAGFLTLAAMEAMRSAEQLVLRTARHGAADALRAQGIAFETLDALYETSEDFDELCERAAAALLKKAEQAGLCYAVADPARDATVQALCRAVPPEVDLHILGGVPLSGAAICAAAACGVDCEDVVEYTALSLARYRPQAKLAQVITEINDRLLASDVKLWLSDLLEDETEVFFLDNAAAPGANARRILLCDLDRQPHYDHRTAMLVPAVDVRQRSRATYEDLVDVIARLRAPDGCPWDRAQTHHTLRRYMIEEAAEAAEAMDGDEPFALADELGDVLLQVVLNSQIGAEHRAFTDRDVTSLITRKMITRHTHVFGQDQADRPEDVLALWDEAKRRERGAQTVTQRMASVSRGLPALMRAQAVRKREAQGRGETLSAEAALREAAHALQGLPQGGEATLGALLEAICAFAEAEGLDAETALRSATEKRIGQAEKADAKRRHKA